MPNAKLLCRLIRLESRMVEHACPCFIVTERIPENDLDQLPEGEKIVLDWFSNNRSFVLARQRVTKDANDQGRQCGPGYYLDVLREVSTHGPQDEKSRRG